MKDDPANLHLAQLVREARERRNLTQEHLAQLASLSTRTIQRLESCGAHSQETLMAVAEIFNTDAVELLRVAKERASATGPSPEPRKLRVFVCYTKDDLADYAKLVQEIATEQEQGLNLVVTLFEQSAGSNLSPGEWSAERARTADIVVVLVGFWWGGTPQKGGDPAKNFVWNEFDAAVDARREIIVCRVSKRDFPSWPPIFFDDQNCEKVKAFREAVAKDRVVIDFTSREDFGQRVRTRLQEVASHLRMTASASIPSQRSTPTNLPGPVPNFSGRTQVLEELRCRLNPESEATESATLALWSDRGGMGKTAVAQQFGWTERKRYPGGVFRIDLGQTTLTDALNEFAGHLGLLRNPKDDVSKEVMRVLSGGPPALLILDNLNDPALWNSISVDGPLSGNRCRILATSSCRFLGPGIEMLQLPPLDANEGAQLVKSILACETAEDRDPELPPNKSLVREIVENFLRGWTHAIKVIAIYLKSVKSVSWPGLHKDLQSKLLQGLDDIRSHELPRLDYRRGLRELLDGLHARLDPLAQRAVDYAAAMPDKIVLRSWLKGLIELDPLAGAPRPIGQLKSSTEAALDQAVEFWLMPAAGDVDRLALHSLDQEYLALRLKAAGHQAAKLLAGIRAFALSRATQLEETASKPSVEELRLLEKVSLGAATEGDWSCAASIASFLCPVLNLFARPETTLAFVEQLWTLAESGGGARPSPMDRACIAHYRGFALHYNQAFDEARYCLKLAVNLAAGAVPPTDPLLASYRSKLARLYLDVLEIEQARAQLAPEPILPVVPSLRHRRLLAEYLSDAAVVEQENSNLRVALELGKRSLEAGRTCYPNDHPDFAAQRVNFAAILIDFGDYLEAKDFIERAIKSFEATFGDAASDNVEMPMLLAKYAYVLRVRGELSRAMEQVERGRGMLGKGRSSLPARSSLLQERAYILEANGMSFRADALQAWQDIVAGIEQVCIRSVVERINAWKMIAAFQRELKRPDDARNAARKSLGIIDDELASRLDVWADCIADFCHGPDPLIDALGEHQANAHIKRAESRLHESAGSDRTALASVMKARASLEPSDKAAIEILTAAMGNVDGSEPKSVVLKALLLEARGDRRFGAGDYDGAGTDFDDAQKRYHQVFFPECLALAQIYRKLSDVAREKSDISGARTWDEKCLHLQERNYVTHHPEIAETCCRLAALCADEERLLKTIEWAERAAKITEEAEVPSPGTRLDALITSAESHRQCGELSRAQSIAANAVELFHEIETQGYPAPPLLCWQVQLARLQSTAERNPWTLEKLEELHQRVMALKENETSQIARGNLIAALGLAASRAEDLDRAKRWTKESLVIQQEWDMGLGGLAVAIRVARYANVLRRSGQLDDALQEIDKAIALAERCVGEKHAALASKRGERALILFDLGRTPEACSELESAIELEALRSGRESPISLGLRQRLHSRAK